MPVGTWIWYAADGKTILDQQLFVEGTGEMMQYSPEGLKEMQTTFVSGSREGPNRTWYPNGVLKSEGTYRGGVLHGTLHEYHTTGVLGTRSEWLWGRKEGRLENWYTNEKPRIVATYRNDLLDGEAREWNEEGNLRSSGTWRQGVRDGVWRWYDDSGQATFTLTYDAGILITSQTATRESDPPISIQ